MPAAPSRDAGCGRAGQAPDARGGQTFAADRHQSPCRNDLAGPRCAPKSVMRASLLRLQMVVVAAVAAIAVILAAGNGLPGLVQALTKTRECSRVRLRGQPRATRRARCAATRCTSRLARRRSRSTGSPAATGAWVRLRRANPAALPAASRGPRAALPAARHPGRRSHGSAPWIHRGRHASCHGSRSRAEARDSASQSPYRSESSPCRRSRSVEMKIHGSLNGIGLSVIAVVATAAACSSSTTGAKSDGGAGSSSGGELLCKMPKFRRSPTRPRSSTRLPSAGLPAA